MSTPIKVAIAGITGYTGMELLRLLQPHPVFELHTVTSRQMQGKELKELFPFLQGYSSGDIKVAPLDVEDVAANCGLVFLAVPHGIAMDLADKFLQYSLKVVDLSADFRLQDKEVFRKWYNLEHTAAHLLSRAVYGLVDIYSQKIKQAEIVANPGCYPTSVLLALYPLLKHGLISSEDIIIDSKSGTSGAGRVPKSGTLFCEVHDSFKAYSLGKHRHTPEIEEQLSRMAAQEVKVSFNPHLLPIDRGIISTIYVRPEKGINLDRIRSVYEQEYKDCSWIRLLPPGVLPETRWVRGTMFCDLGILLDERLQRAILVSAIDNLNRGAAGQAIANANLMSGLQMDLGLKHLPFMP